jgi:hypothetical protein
MADSLPLPAAAAAIIVNKKRRKQRHGRRGRIWSRQWLLARSGCGGMQHFVLNELSPDAAGFHSFLRMSPDAYNLSLGNLQAPFSVLLYTSRACRTTHAMGITQCSNIFFFKCIAESSTVHLSAIVSIR